MMSKEIDPNILRQNIKYLRELEYYPVKEFDEHESITPTTNKGHLTQGSKEHFFKKVKEKLQGLKEQNETVENFYTKVQGDFENQEQVEKFLIHQEFALNSFVSDNILIKKYQYKDSKISEVLRFGINSYNKDLIQEIGVKYNPSIKKEEAVPISDTISVFSKSTKDKAADALNKNDKFQELKAKAKNQVTSTEQSVVTQAIDYLNESGRKTALVDLFARHTKDGQYKSGHKYEGQKFISGHIKYTKDGTLETHTVVLYKQGSKYLVIDPSNAEFSAILVGAHNDIRVCFSKKFQVYQPIENAEEEGLLGSKPNQWRDCIDIAVKLAFNLNRNEQLLELEQFNEAEVIKTDSLKNNISIEEISNNTETHKVLPGELDYYPLRTKQSSNIVEGKLYNTALKYLFNTYKALETKITEMNFFYIGKKFHTIREKYFLKDYNSEDYGSAIKDLQGIFYDIKNSTDVGEIKLLAEEMKAIESIFYEA